MVRPSKHFYEFGPFRIDSSKRRLLRNGEVVPLTPKAFDTLVALIESGDRVVEKDDLMEKVWPGVAVEENNLTQNISALRKALGEKRDEPQFILTVPGRGYRFVADISESSDEMSGTAASATSAPAILSSQDEGQTVATQRASGASSSNLSTRGSNRRTLVGASAAVVLAIAGVYVWITTAARRDATATEIRSIAVLPFKPLVAAGSDEYLGLGMADALITRLSNISQIMVRPTSSVAKYANSGEELTAIGRELGVDSLLEGRVQKSNDRIRVTVTLVRVRDGAPLWASKFDEQYTDVFTVEDRISEQVAGSLLPTLTGTQKEQLTKHYTEDTEAYQSYIQGRYWWNKRSVDGLKKAIGHFEDAILSDPNYALAYSGLADSYATLRLFDVRQEDVMPKARSAALRALEIDDTLAEAHASLGYVKHRYEWDFSGAEREFKRAIELKPEYSTAHQWYGWYLVTVGSFDQALEEFKRAQQLDPLSLYVNLTVGMPFFFSKQYDKAGRQFNKVIEMDPNFALAHRWLAKTYQQEGRYEQARTEFEKAISLLGGGAESAPALGYIDAITGKQAAARALLDQLKKTSQRHDFSYYIAIIYAGLGEKDHAFEWLDRAYEERLGEMVDLKNDPQLDSLRSDPRFSKLIERTGFPR